MSGHGKEWHTPILEAHPGYVSWAEYEENFEWLRQLVRGLVPVECAESG